MPITLSYADAAVAARFEGNVPTGAHRALAERAVCRRRSEPEVNVEIGIRASGVVVPGDLEVPEGARGIVVFAHGSGSSRLSTRNRFVASVLRRSGSFGTLLFDLLTPDEDTLYANRFDIGLLADRLEAATHDVGSRPEAAGLPVGYFGASTGAAAAIVAAARLPELVLTVVSRGGRPDLAGPALLHLHVPILLIVGSLDRDVIELNEQALAAIPHLDKRLEIVPGATHLFEEPGTLAQAADLASAWFERTL
jgi:pimeloyl-ACP methyl ester carboxylesterase